MATATPATGTAPPAARTGAPPAASRRSGTTSGLYFVLPFMIVFAVFLVWPIITGFTSTFYNRSLAGTASEFLGLGNWRELVGDPTVWKSLGNTVVFTVLSTPILAAVGLRMAMLAHRSGRLGWLLRFSYFAPFVLPATVVSLIWVWLYQPQFGLFDGTLTSTASWPRPSTWTA